MFAKKIGVDLGTSTMRIYVRGEGIVVDEPSVVAVDHGSGRLLAIGEQALHLAAQAPRTIRLARPVRRGLVADRDLAEGVLQRLVLRAQGRQRLFRPEVMICVHAGAPGAERRALTEAAIAAGARQAWLIEAPLAAAMGVGLPVAESGPYAVCELGGGASQAAVISMSGVVAVQTVPVGGDDMSAAVAALVRSRDGREPSEAEAEALKRRAGVDGSTEVAEAIGPALRAIAGAVRRVLDQTPAALVRDLPANGLVLTGGGALLAGIDRYLASETGLRVAVAEDPRTCAVRGTRRALGEFEVLQRRQLYLR